MMRFAMLGSGSKGNATVIEHGTTRILIDCGFNLRETEARLLRLGIEAASLSAILVTHEHGDHLGGVGRLARRHRIPVWMTYGTRRAWNDPDVPHLIRFSPHQRFEIGVWRSNRTRCRTTPRSPASTWSATASGALASSPMLAISRRTCAQCSLTATR